MRHGSVPYRDFAVEYPPGALPVFVAAVARRATTPSTFALADGGAAASLLVARRRVRSRRAARVLVALSPLLAGSLDPLALRPLAGAARRGALAALLARPAPARLGAARRGGRGEALAGRARAARARLDGARAAAAWAALVGARRRSRWRSCRSRSSRRTGSGRSFSGQASRPLQIESLGRVAPDDVRPPARSITTHGSQNIAGHGALAAAFARRCRSRSLVALWIAFARGPATASGFLRYAAACVCAFIAFGKVLSPQFLIWLVPLVPLVARPPRARGAVALLTAALVLTQVWFPERYFDYAGAFHLAWVVAAPRSRARRPRRAARLAGGQGCARGLNSSHSEAQSLDHQGGGPNGAHSACERSRRGSREARIERRPAPLAAGF